MPESVFPYPGGKFYHANWILDTLPAHKTYVEPFGGAGTLLLNKQRAPREIYNDADGDLVQFFETLRDSPDELVEWLKKTPYSRELHERYSRAFYGGERAADPVERAGRFFYLRYSQHSSKYESRSGFLAGKSRPHGRYYANAVEKLETHAERFRGVLVEHCDFTELFGRYDSPDTVFYCDPPYFGSEGRYLHTDFSHDDLAAALGEIDGYWAISYSQLPPAAEALARSDEMYVSTRNTRSVSMSIRAGESKDQPETLVTNFDPAEIESAESAGQATLAQRG